MSSVQASDSNASAGLELLVYPKTPKLRPRKLSSECPETESFWLCGSDLSEPPSWDREEARRSSSIVRTKNSVFSFLSQLQPRKRSFWYPYTVFNNSFVFWLKWVYPQAFSLSTSFRFPCLPVLLFSHWLGIGNGLLHKGAHWGKRTQVRQLNGWDGMAELQLGVDIV
jgi:hypothetical protein